ncbi:hypothetical protein KR054_007345 [Drosophila jambulina]|nr:hypothetical protein KR054_007345 [Drosophila jambulina]
MTKRSYSALQEEVNAILTREDERTQEELDVLQLKLDHILSNQDEILTRLGVVAQGRYGNDVYEVDVSYFPISDPEELPKLDAYLAEPGNSYARLMRRLLRPDDIQKTRGYIVTDYIAELREAFHAAKSRCHKRSHDQRRRSHLSRKIEAENEWD